MRGWRFRSKDSIDRFSVSILLLLQALTQYDNEKNHISTQYMLVNFQTRQHGSYVRG